MRILYIFPHPDDESFGPVAAINQQIGQGHEVHLLTLTRGGATRIRFEMNLSIEKMGEVRYSEMLDVAKTVGLSGMTVLDMPDGGLSELDPRQIGNAIRKEIERLKPSIIVTYPVHGISGFHDHIVTHSVVKRLYLDMVDSGNAYLKRLAFFTLPDNGQPTFSSSGIRLKHSSPENIDCILDLTEDDIGMMKKALDCYVSYQATIAASGVKNKVRDQAYFELFGESFDPPLKDLTSRLS